MSKPIRKADYDLPVSMCRLIGRLIVRYAYMEAYLQKMIYMVLNVSSGAGRLAVREPRAKDRLDLLRDLIATRGLTEPDLDYKMMREAIEDLEDIRNLCAHSTWTRSNDGWAVEIARGQWEGVPKSDRARRNKRLFPEGQIIRPSHLATYVKGTESVILILRSMQAKLEAQLKSSP